MTAGLWRGKRVFYGWWIVLELAITETIAWGIVYYAFTVFITPMEAELGWSRSIITGAFSLSLLISGVMAFPVGWWIDRHGARWLMTGGVIAASILVYAWAHVYSVWAYFFVWIGLGFTMSMILYEPAMTVVAKWFIRYRGRALMMITIAAGFASTIFIPLADWLLEKQGWRGATETLAIILAVGTIPLHGLVLRRKPEDLGFLPDGASEEEYMVRQSTNRSVSLQGALRSASFWWLTTAFSFAALGVIAVRVHIIPLLIDRNVDSHVAAWAAGSIGAMQVLGRIVFAPLDERFSSRVMTASIFAILATALIMLRFMHSSLGIGMFVVVFGMAYGSMALARPSMLADYFGPEHYGRISSIMAFFFTAASTFAPVGTSWLYDRWHNYDPILWIMAFSLAISFGAVLLARPVQHAKIS